ncbi:hypothetical protein IFM89_016342 [Coptis chinensis]|uniref:T-complex protein 1 subunit delta n=1 Tax=Coptis chinensis TaxID=261450 RepID=A0A835HDH3_9MAGN|nr:hypothetical protein IFM89_016342 [Coptis chinensis]
MVNFGGSKWYDYAHRYGLKEMKVHLHLILALLALSDPRKIVDLFKFAQAQSFLPNFSVLKVRPFQKAMVAEILASDQNGARLLGRNSGCVGAIPSASIAEAGIAFMIVKKLGGTVDDTELVKGLVLIRRILKEERNYILGMIKKIKATGCNVLLIQKSILRDAVTDLSLHYLSKAKILVVKDVERDAIEFITKTLNCLPIANIEHFHEEKMGRADCVEEVSLGDGGKIVKITGIKDMGKDNDKVLVRGSNRLVPDEAERSLHDALCVIRCLVTKKFLIAWWWWCAGNRNVEPRQLGLNPIAIVTELRNRHAQGEINTGINVRKGQITNILEENVVQPLLVSTSAITLATECVRMILKIDDIITVRIAGLHQNTSIGSTDITDMWERFWKKAKIIASQSDESYLPQAPHQDGLCGAALGFILSEAIVTNASMLLIAFLKIRDCLENRIEICNPY